MREAVRHPRVPKRVAISFTRDGFEYKSFSVFLKTVLVFLIRYYARLMSNLSVLEDDMSGELHVFFDAEGTLYGPREGKTCEEFWNHDERTAERAKEHFALDPDVPRLLQALKDRGHRLYVLSRNVEQVLFPLMSHFGIRKYFDEVVIREDKAKFLVEFRRRKGLAADQIVMVGDTPELDIRPVKENGIKAIHLDCSGKPRIPETVSALRQVLRCLDIADSF